jgi:hypothetical protein
MKKKKNRRGKKEKKGEMRKRNRGTREAVSLQAQKRWATSFNL